MKDAPPAPPSVQNPPPAKSSVERKMEPAARNVLIVLGVVALAFIVVLAVLMSRSARTVTSNPTLAQPVPTTSPEATGSPRAATPAALPAAATDKWRRGEDGASETDETKTVVFQLDAENEVSGSVEKSRPALVARCLERRTTVYVVTGMAANPEIGGLNRRTVRIRFDEGAAMSQVWAQSSDSVSLFSPDPKDFARRLARARKLTFRFTPLNAAAATAEFDVSGFEAHLATLAKACGWKP